MKPAPFKYLAPSTLEEALDHLAEYGDEAKPLAGGQSLVPTMNFRLAQPAVLVDLNGIEDLSYIRGEESGGLCLGAMARQRAAEKSALVRERTPLLAETLPAIAHPQIRNRGTVGGSLAHADPAAELPAVMLALEARLRLRRRGQERTLPARDFFVGLFDTALHADELLVEVALPAVAPRTGWAFREFSRRHGDYALVGVAAVVSLDESDLLRDVRLAYLSVGEGPVIAQEACRLLSGQSFSSQVVEEAAQVAATRDTDPPGDIHASPAYRRHLIQVLTVEALNQAWERAGGAGSTEGRAG